MLLSAPGARLGTGELVAMTLQIIIAVDGPAASGKTTLARKLSERLGFELIETGRYYRTVGFALRAAGWNLDDTDSLGRFISDLSLPTLEAIPASEVAGEDVARFGSRAAGYAATRDHVTAWVRARLARCQDAGRGVVVEGRDAGTVACPHAWPKFYVIADVRVRAERRAAQLGVIVPSPAYDTLLADLMARDDADSTRVNSPLRKATDAIEIDTGSLGVDAALDRMLDHIADRTRRPPRGACVT